MGKSDQRSSKSTPKKASPSSGLVKKCMNCGLTMPWSSNCECLLQIGKDIRARLKRQRETAELTQTDRPREKKRPSKQDAETDGLKQGGLF